MATNPYLDNEGYAPEQDLYEDLTIEALQFYGQDFRYVPREIVRKDDLFGEDTGSRFTDGYDVEMYVENLEGYEGQELFQKFGVEIRDEGTLVVARKRWNEEVGTPGSMKRPREGDLVYVPFSKSIFEITFVEHEEPFYQLNNLPVYKLRVSLFEYNGEDLDIEGVDTSKIESAYGQILTLDSTGAFETGETVTQVQNTGTVTGEVQSIDGLTLVVSNVSSDGPDYREFSTGSIVSSTSALTRAVVSVKDSQGAYGANDEIETMADNIIDFDESHPFGEF